MKPEQKEASRALRREGYSLGQVAEKLQVSKSSVSNWVRDIELTQPQKEILRKASGKSLGRAMEVYQKKTQDRHDQWRREAEAEWPILSRDPFFMFGLALYLGEGGKTEPCCLRFSNANAGIIRKAIDFFILVGVPRDQLRLTIHLQDISLVPLAEQFWIAETGIPKSQFMKTRVATSSASLGKRRTLPQGTVGIYAGSSRIRKKLEVWMRLGLE